MARNSFMSTIVLTIDNKNAKDMLADLEKSMQRAKKELADLQEKMNDPQSWSSEDSIKSLQKRERELKKTIKSYESALGQGVSQRKGIDEVLANLSKADYNELTSVRTSLTAAIKNLDQSSKKYKELLEKLQNVRDEITGRDIDVRGGMTTSRAKEVMKSLDSSSYADIKDATETMKKMQAQLEPSSNKWKTYGKQIADATNYLKKWDDQAKRTQMLQATKGDLGKMSDSDLQQQLRYWDGIVNGIGRTNVAVTQYKKILETLQAEQSKRTGRVMGKVEAGDLGGSIAEMQNRLKLLQDYRSTIDSTKPDAYVRVDAAIEKLTQGIKESQAGFLSYADAMKQAEGLADGSFKGSISDLDKMKKTLEEYKGTLKMDDTAGLEKVNGLLGNIEQKQKELQSGYMSYTQAMDKAGQVMDGSFEGSIADLEKLQKVLTEYRSSLDVKDTEGLKDVDARLESITKKMQELKPGFMSFQDALAKAKQVSDGSFEGTIEDLDKLQKVLKEGMSAELNIGSDEDVQKLKESTALLDGIVQKQKELADINKRENAEAAVRKVRTNIAGSSPAEIEEAIRLAKDLQKMNGTSAAQYKSLAQFIGEAEAQLKTWNDQVKHAAMEDQFLRLATLSKNALEEQQKYWQSVYDNAEKGTAKYIQAERKLADINQTLTNRKSDEAGAIMGNLQGSSVADIERAIKMTEELMKAHSRGSQEYEIYAEEIKKAKEYLQSYVDLDKQVDMEDKWSQLRTLSTDALAEQKKYWQEMVNGAQQGTQELQDYQDKLKAVVEEERMRLDNQATKVLAKPTDYSVKEVQDAVKAYEQIRDAQRLGSGEWEYYNKKIEDTRATLKKYNDEAKATVMEGRLGGLATASTASLAEQKKYWQEMVNGAERGTQALKDYQENLDKVLAEEKTRIQNAAQQTMTEYNTGNWNKTIGETKEAIKQLQEYRNTLNAKSDAKALADVDKVLSELTQKTKEAEQGYIDLTTALRNAESLGNFSGTLEDLEKLKKRLEEIRQKEIKLGDPDAETNLKQIDEALVKVDKKLDDLKNGALDLERVLKNPKAASFEELERAAKVLEKQIKRCAENTAEFAAKSEELRKVNKQLDEIKKSFQEQENIILKTAKRLASYVLVYAGFNEIVGWMKQGVNANLELSDSMADVQKTTGLAGIELHELGRSLEEMDTRTATTELYQLAAAAGQIGLKSQEDILGFADAANKISVALNELGAEGSASLMKIAQLTGELRDNSTEDALLRIGSAINDLTANSAATAGPITDFINRFGGIAAAARISTYEMAALGAATDASAQSAEVAGTSMNKFVNALLANTQSVAYAADISYKELQGLIDSGKTMDAIVLVLERMQGMSAGAQQGLLKELGSEGARMNQYVSTLVANLDMLKDQLEISRNAYQENISIQNEYNVKNESAIGILQRMKNQIIDTFVNSGMTEALKDILVFISEIPAWLDRNRVAAAALYSVLVGIMTLKIPAFLATLGTAFKQLGTLIAGSFVQVWKKAAWDLQVAMVYAGKSVAEATAATTGFTGALRVLAHVIKTHPFMFIASVLASVAVAIWTLTDRTDKLAEATEELRKKQAREAQELNTMKDVILGVNSSYEAQMRVLKDLNSVYEKYLGFEINILDSYAKKAAALDLITAKLKEQQELELYNKERETINENFAEESKDSMETIEEAFTSIPEIGRKRWAEVKDIINEALRTGELVMTGNDYQDQKAVSQFTQVKILEKLGIATDKLNAKQKQMLYDIVDDVKEYATIYTDTQEQLNNIDEKRLGQIEVNAKKTREGWKAVAEAQKQDMDVAEADHKLHLGDIRKKGAEEKKTEEDINKEIAEAEERHQKDMLKKNQEYLKTLGQLRDAETQDIDIKTKAIVETEDIDSLRQGVEGVRKALDEDAIKAVENFRNTTAEIKKIEEELGSGRLKTEEEVHDKTVELRKLQRKQAEELQTAQRKAAVFMVREWTDAYTKVEEKIKDTTDLMQGDPYGKKWNLEDWKTFGAGTIKNLGTASIDSLTATYKALEDESQTITKDISWFNDTFKELLKKPIESQKEMDKLVYQWAGQVKRELESRNRGTTGNFIWKSVGGGSDKEAEREARKELNAVMAALEEHFLKRKAIIQQAYLDEKISGAEMNRQIADNDEEFRRARIELRKELVGKANTFNQSLYPELKGKDIQRTAKFLQQIGDVVTDGIRKNIQKDEVEIRDGAIKLRQAFEEELLKRDLFGKFENEFRNSLDNLELLSSDFERKTAKTMATRFGISEKSAGLSEENQKKRLQALIKLSEKSYQINEQGMVDELAKNKEFAIWIQNLDAEQRTVLLQNLRDYYDQRLMLQKQYTERLGKEMEAWYEQSGQQKDYEATKTKIEKRTAENDVLSGFGVEKDYGDEEKNITDEFVNEFSRLDKLREKAMEHRNTLVEGSQEYIATTALITQYEQEQNALLAQGQRDLTQVYMEEWQKRAERWGEWGEMFGDYLGEQVMLEKQANDARVRGDEEAAEEIEKRQKKNKEELIKTALTKVVDLAAVWAKEFALKMMYNSLMEASDQQRTLSEVTNQGKATTLSILLDALKGQAHEHGKGLSGLVTGAIIFAATMALQAMAKSAIANMFPEAASETNKATGGRLATGMLTYADGNYPVLGNDGNVYNAKYEGSEIKTGIYRGGAHFGIFSEKKPEAIIDGDTTQRLIMNHPDIWKAIVTLSKTGRLDGGMRTFAAGNINDLARQAQDIETTAAVDSSAQMMEMQATMAATQQTLAQLTQVLAGGITARMDMYGENGAFKQLKKAEKFANRVGYK